jgi:hypothetical protein
MTEDSQIIIDDVDTPEQEDNGEKAFSEGYKKAYEDLVQNKGFSPRKARRYLDSVAKRNVRKFMKGKK